MQGTEKSKEKLKECHIMLDIFTVHVLQFYSIVTYCKAQYTKDI